MKRYQTDFKVGKPYGVCYVSNRNTELEYREGEYTFCYGVVMFYSEPTFATFSFVFEGRVHGLSISEIKKPLTDRQLIILAGKFGREIVCKFK